VRGFDSSICRFFAVGLATVEDWLDTGGEDALKLLLGSKGRARRPRKSPRLTRRGFCQHL